MRDQELDANCGKTLEQAYPNKSLRDDRGVWEDPVASFVDGNSELLPLLEEAPISLDVLISNSDGFLFPLPLENAEQSAGTTVKKGKAGRKANFTPEEDDQLAELVKTYGETKWSLIASIMKKWNRKQLRERYINFIKGKSTAANFTAAEDAVIAEHIKVHGHAWKDLTAKLPGRSPIAIKNRYYKVILKKTPLLSVSSEDMRRDTVSDRVSTKCNSVNEKLCDKGFTLEEKIQILFQQEEKFIEGIKRIEEKINTIYCSPKAGN